MTDSELQTKRMIAAAIDIAISIAIGVGIAIASFAAAFALGHASDSAVAMYVPRVLGFGGAAIQLGYVLCRDILGGGRSLGKKFQDIRVVTVAGGEISFMDSVKRNAIFAIGSTLGMLASTLQLIPCLGDAVACLLTPLMVLGGLISLVAAVVEMVKITSEPEGIRMGDAFAGTRVIR